MPCARPRRLQAAAAVRSARRRLPAPCPRRFQAVAFSRLAVFQAVALCLALAVFHAAGSPHLAVFQAAVALRLALNIFQTVAAACATPSFNITAEAGIHMSSSKRTPFQDITNRKNLDPKEAKRQRDREYYAKNKDEILKRRRQARELKKQASPTTPVNEGNAECHTPTATLTGLTQLQFRTPSRDFVVIAPVVPETGASPIPQQESSQFYANGSLNHIEGRVSGQSWYARLSDEKRAEYIQRQRTARQQKKAASQSGISRAEVSLPQCTPFSNGTMSQANDASPEVMTCKPREDTPGFAEIGYAHSCMTNVEEDDTDWLHSNLTCIPHVRYVQGLQNMSPYVGGHGQKSYVDKIGYSEKKRQRDNSENKRKRERERYSSMTDAQKDACLHNNRDYKKLVRDHSSPLITSRCTPDMQTKPSKIYPTVYTNSDDESDHARIFEPFEKDAGLQGNIDTIQEEQTIPEDDEESRIFSGQGDVFDSYRVTNDVAPSNQNDDPYDYVYHNLPTKHHVLKPVKDCIYCGAMRLQYEGPAFCCKKGMVKIVTPEVPQELRRLFTSQVDEDAKYFRKHIRYFNTHFSFTSLGVTLDKNVSNAAKTGVYTFRAQGALYYKMDDLVPGGQGPRHLQLYIYDTDETRP